MRIWCDGVVKRRPECVCAASWGVAVRSRAARIWDGRICCGDLELWRACRSGARWRGDRARARVELTMEAREACAELSAVRSGGYRACGALCVARLVQRSRDPGAYKSCEGDLRAIQVGLLPVFAVFPFFWVSSRSERELEKDQFNTNWCLSTARKWLSIDDNRQSKVFLVLRVSVDRPELAVDSLGLLSTGAVFPELGFQFCVHLSTASQEPVDRDTQCWFSGSGQGFLSTASPSSVDRGCVKLQKAT
ncbi:hypothetical protein Taro_002910 [Colocasia esculenta]|uniref:Uncharacterized protein n=1 Tax=Colocasia esculenta TaxID=4460 RepID=A0A843TM81_COLES|nr:hypothetical protein [Colocasia esculenta]